LGEQSPKVLRSTKMEEIIFAGSCLQRPLGMAEVRLTLDNSRGFLPLDFLEVEISRRFFRSGEGEYILNGQRCRLKDIQRLLIPLGLGRYSMNFVAQGHLEQLLKAPLKRGGWF